MARQNPLGFRWVHTIPRLDDAKVFSEVFALPVPSGEQSEQLASQMTEESRDQHVQPLQAYRPISDRKQSVDDKCYHDYGDGQKGEIRKSGSPKGIPVSKENQINHVQQQAGQS
jgi:hypothetical protein